MWQVIKDFFSCKKPQEVSAPEVFTCAPPPVPSVPATPYRTASPMEKLICTLQGEGERDLALVNTIKEKTRRRAVRYFAGKEVRHRVTSKKPDSIEFKFFRRSGRPMTISWALPTQ